MSEVSHYSLPTRVSLTHWRERLREELSLQADASGTYLTHYYDSFDWRLAEDGKTLRWQQHGPDSRLWLDTDASGGESIVAYLDAAPPRFAADLPDGRLKRELDNLLDGRALLPLATIATRTSGFRLTDGEDKTRSRLYLNQHRMELPGGRHRTLRNELQLVALKGYRKDTRHIAVHLEKVLGLAPATPDLLGLALDKLGRHRGDYTSALNIALDADMRADAALRRILLSLLDTIQANEPGIEQDIDSEFLHDFRVAVRRTRSALAQVKAVFPVHTLERFRTEFAWLGDGTSPTRDLDVYLQKFSGYQDLLPAQQRNDLEPLRTFLQQHRIQELAALHAQLRGARYRKLKRQWRNYLVSPLPRRPTASAARKPVLQVAGRRIWKAYRRVLRQGLAITPDSVPRELHELRKTCKKLRYLMEFFQSLYPAKAIRKLIRELKALQDNLGDFQDLDVQRTTLQRFSEQMQREGDLAGETLLAMNTLRLALAEKEARVRGEFEARFGQFARHADKQRFERLFKPADK